MATMTPTTARERRVSSNHSGMQLRETGSSQGALEGAPAPGRWGGQQEATIRRQHLGRQRAASGEQRGVASSTAGCAARISGSIGAVEASVQWKYPSAPSCSAERGADGCRHGRWSKGCGGSNLAYLAVSYAYGADATGAGSQGSVEGTAQQATLQLAAGQPWEQVASCRVVDSSLDPRATALCEHGPTGAISLRTQKRPWVQLSEYNTQPCLLAAYRQVHEVGTRPHCYLALSPHRPAHLCECTGRRNKEDIINGPGLESEAGRGPFTPTACLLTPVHVTEIIAVWPRGEICQDIKMHIESDQKTHRNWRAAKKVITLRRDRVRHWHSRNWLALHHRLAWMLESSGGTYA
jgi:hypothetical protein